MNVALNTWCSYEKLKEIELHLAIIYNFLPNYDLEHMRFPPELFWGNFLCDISYS